MYSESFRTKLVQKMLVPNARPVSVLALEAGVSEGTLFRWKKEATLGAMPTDGPGDKTPPSSNLAKQWSAEEKLAVVFEAAAVADAEMGAFLRRRGLHAAQLAEWRKQVTEAAIMKGAGFGGAGVLAVALLVSNVGCSTNILHGIDERAANDATAALE